MSPGSSPLRGPTSPVKGRDLLIVATLAFFALVFFLDRLRGAVPFVFLEGDAANIAGFAAALDHPELFAGDEVLGDPDHFRFYRTIHIPLLRALATHFSGYGTAFIALLPWHVLFQAVGFYVLGRVLFRSRYWALLLAVLNLAPVWVGFGTYWGLYVDPQPRFSFQSLLPFLLAAALRWSDEPRRWPWIMAGAGLLMYVHPVSAPAWAFSLWLGFFFSRPRPLSDRRHLVRLIALGLLFLLVSAPFLVNYLGHHAQGDAAGADYERVRALFEEKFGKEFLNIPNGLRRFALRWTWGERAYWVLAACGAAFLIRRNRTERKRLMTVFSWGAGIGLVGVVLPLVEQEVCRRLGVLPPEIDLARNIRYFVPLMFLFCLWPLAVAERPIGVGRWVLRGAGALLVSVWIGWHPPLRLDPWIDCWRTGQVACLPAGWSERLDTIEAVRREVPAGGRILAREMHLELRYHALRPVVYAPKDRGVLSYTDPAALLRWDDLRREMAVIDGDPDPENHFAALAALATRLDAEFLLLRSAEIPAGFEREPEWELVWSNDLYGLVGRRP